MGEGIERKRVSEDDPTGISVDEVQRREESDDSGFAWPWVAASAGVLALGVLVYFAIGWFSEEPSPREPGPQGRLVEAATVESSGGLSVSQTGFVEPVEQLTLEAEVSGRVARVAEEFRVGRLIEAGTSLIELDKTRFEAEVAAAEARLAAAQAQRDTARANVERQQRLDEAGFAADARVEEIEIGLLPRQRDLLKPDASLVGRTADVFSVDAARRKLATGRIAAIDPVPDPAPGDAQRVLTVPVAALKGADRLWRITDEGTLEGIEPIIVRRSEADVQILAEGLQPGDRVLLTDLAAAASGTRVRVASEAREAHTEDQGEAR